MLIVTSVSTEATENDGEMETYCNSDLGDGSRDICLSFPFALHL